MVCLSYPAVRIYWARETKIPVIYNFMSCNSFFSCARIYIRNIEISFREHLYIDITNSIDEQIISFTGGCPARQLIQLEPRPVGFKNLVCVTSNGVVVNFEIFQSPGTFKDYCLGHGPSIIIRLIKNIPKSSHIYMDCFFTRIP